MAPLPLKDVKLERDVRDQSRGHTHPWRQSRASVVTALCILCLWVQAFDLWPKWTSLGLKNESKTRDMAEGGFHGSQVQMFSEITPSKKLQWHPCYEDYFCARLTVPMDYHRPLSKSHRHPAVHIAMVLVPGANHTSAEQFSSSPILINPGGPGGSGIEFATKAARKLHTIFGEDQDFIGFDPRGVGETTPPVDCFAFPSAKMQHGTTKPPSEQDVLHGRFNAMLWEITHNNAGIVNSSSNALDILDIRYRALSSLCKQKDEIYGEDSILRHLSTPVVSRDMLSIVDAWDNWIETASEGKPRIERPFAHLKGQLSYWGGSYGSLLGETFAAIYPSRVGRLVIDAIVNADYYVAPVWVDALEDAEKVLESFFGYCYLAGPACAIYQSGDTRGDIWARYHAIMDRLKARTGVVAIHPRTRQPVVITYSHIRLFLFLSMYQPVALFPLAAYVLNALHREDPSAIFNDLIPIPELSFSLGKFCASDDSIPAQGESPFNVWEANMAIKCGDKRYILNETIPNLTSLFQLLSVNTSWGDVWMTSQLGCDGWDIPSSDPPLPWNPDKSSSPHPSAQDIQVNTLNPVLFVTSTYDPVCPMRGALKMARRFVGAGFLEQKSVGHGTFSVASSCTNDVIRNYFKDLKIPDGSLEDGNWKTCEPDETPWNAFRKDEWMQQFSEVQGVKRAELEAAAVRMEAVKEIQKILAERKSVGY